MRAAAAAGARRLHGAGPRVRHGPRLLRAVPSGRRARTGDRRRHDVRSSSRWRAGIASGTPSATATRAPTSSCARATSRTCARSTSPTRSVDVVISNCVGQPLARQAARLPRDLPRVEAGRRALLLGRLRRSTRARRAATRPGAARRMPRGSALPRGLPPPHRRGGLRRRPRRDERADRARRPGDRTADRHGDVPRRGRSAPSSSRSRIAARTTGRSRPIAARSPSCRTPSSSTTTIASKPGARCWSAATRPTCWRAAVTPRTFAIVGDKADALRPLRLRAGAGGRRRRRGGACC